MYYTHHIYFGMVHPFYPATRVLNLPRPCPRPGIHHMDESFRLAQTGDFGEANEDLPVTDVETSGFDDRQFVAAPPATAGGEEEAALTLAEEGPYEEDRADDSSGEGGAVDHASALVEPGSAGIASAGDEEPRIGQVGTLIKRRTQQATSAPTTDQPPSFRLWPSQSDSSQAEEDTSQEPE
jgi:hypothetical protein